MDSNEDCPYCGGSDVAQRATDDDTMYVIRCKDCGGRGGPAGTVFAAWMLWNLRAENTDQRPAID